MAIIDHNIITTGLHGRVGNLIFRRWGEKTVVSAAPGRTDRRWSRLQRSNRERFSSAMAWAKEAMKDPEKRKGFQKKAKGMQTAWNVAVSEYMMRPLIEEADVSGYHGKKGDQLRVRTGKTFRVSAVIITILSAQGLIIETGMAARVGGTNGWVYSATTHNPDPDECRIRVKVTSRSGDLTQVLRAVQRK